MDALDEIRGLRADLAQFRSSSLIYVFIVCCLKSRFYFICLYFFHTCGYAFCLSVLGNIQVDSIKLLSTLATDG